MLQSCHPSWDKGRRTLPEWRDFPLKAIAPGNRGWPGCSFAQGKIYSVVGDGENSLLSSEQPSIHKLQWFGDAGERWSVWMMLGACSSWWQCCWQGWRGWSAWRCPVVQWSLQQVKLTVEGCVGCPPTAQLGFAACERGVTPMCLCCVPSASWRMLGFLPAALQRVSQNLGPAGSWGTLLSQVWDGPALFYLLPNCFSLGGAGGPAMLPAISPVSRCCLGCVPQRWLGPAAEGDTESRWRNSAGALTCLEFHLKPQRCW